MATLGDIITGACCPIKVREYVNVWFPSKYTSASALMLKQIVLFMLSNGPRIGPLDVNMSEASKGENVYCNMDKVIPNALYCPHTDVHELWDDDLMNSYILHIIMVEESIL